MTTAAARLPLDLRCMRSCLTRACDANRDCHALRFNRGQEVRLRLAELGAWLAVAGAHHLPEAVDAVFFRGEAAACSAYHPPDGTLAELIAHRNSLAAVDRAHVRADLVRHLESLLRHHHPLFRHEDAGWSAHPEDEGITRDRELARVIRAGIELLRAEIETESLRHEPAHGLARFVEAAGHKTDTILTLTDLAAHLEVPATADTLEALADAAGEEPGLTCVLLDPRLGRPWLFCRADAVPRPPTGLRDRRPDLVLGAQRPIQAWIAAPDVLAEPGDDESVARAPRRGARVVLRRSHFLHGAIPLDGAALVFFPDAPARVALELRWLDLDVTGRAWLDNEQGVLYGMRTMLLLADYGFGTVIEFMPLDRPGGYTVRSVDVIERIAAFDAADGVEVGRRGPKPAALTDTTPLWTPLLADLQGLEQRAQRIAGELADAAALIVAGSTDGSEGASRRC